MGTTGFVNGMRTLMASMSAALASAATAVPTILGTIFAADDSNSGGPVLTPEDRDSLTQLFQALVPFMLNNRWPLQNAVSRFSSGGQVGMFSVVGEFL